MGSSIGRAPDCGEYKKARKCESFNPKSNQVVVGSIPTPHSRIRTATMYESTTLPDGLYWAQEGSWYPTKVEVTRGLVFDINGRVILRSNLDLYGPLETQEEQRTPPEDMVRKYKDGKHG